MSVKIPDAVALVLCNALVDLIDAGAGAGVLNIYNAVQPADPDAVITDTLLAQPVFSLTAFGAAAIVTAPVDAAEAVAAAITPESNAVAGTAGHFNIADSAGAPVLSGTVTATGGGGDLELSTLTIPAGGTVSITDAKIRVTRNAA